MDAYFDIFSMIIGAIMPIVLILLVGGIWWHSDLSKKEIREKYEQGRSYLVDATVLKVGYTIVRGHKRWRRNYYAIVEYMDKYNHLHKGRVSVAELKFVNPGYKMTILYDPENEKVYPASYSKKPNITWTIVIILIIVGSIICILDKIGVF